MNGPQHYTVAEQLLGTVKPTSTLAETQTAAALAQVHATLALVAAQVDAAELDIADEYGTEVVTDWGKAVQES